MRHFYHCPHVNTPEACDIDGPRERLCETCLTTLVREERPPGWSPRVPKREGEKSLLFSERYGNPRRSLFDTLYGSRDCCMACGARAGDPCDPLCTFGKKENP